MHIVNNLNYETSIVDQLDSYACATNLAFPKDEDFAYKYSELDDGQKDTIFGMAMMLDAMQNEEYEINLDNDETIIGKMTAEIKGEYLNELFNSLVCQMDMMLVSFGDDNACEDEDSGE